MFLLWNKASNPSDSARRGFPHTALLLALLVCLLVCGMSVSAKQCQTLTNASIPLAREAVATATGIGLAQACLSGSSDQSD